MPGKYKMKHSTSIYIQRENIAVWQGKKPGKLKLFAGQNLK